MLRLLPFALCLLPLAFLTPTAQAQPARKPNIILILADDLGQRDLGCYGSTFYETPNLDALAKQGLRFTDAYAACNVCSPTRAALLTGKYPARLHLTDWLPGKKDSPQQKLNRPNFLNHLPENEVTLAQALKDGGYATALVGKWHLGGPNYWPPRFGFDRNVAGGTIGHPPSYFSPYKIPNLPDGPKGEYLTDRLTDEACTFIESNKDKPFFLYFPQYAVHTPIQAKPELVKKFEQKLGAMPPSGAIFAQDLGRQVRQRQTHAAYAALLASLDQSVGRIMQTLADLNLENDTILIFTSDNGGLSTSEGTPTSNLPLRMGKGWNYEGGIREPLIVRWPGVTKPNSTTAAQTITTDFYPTLLQAAGLPPRPKQHLDGISILPALKGQPLPERPLFWHYPHYSNQGGPPGAAMRLGDLKLIEHYEDDKLELYDLAKDPGERHDLASTHPDQVKALHAQLQAWRKSVDAQMPTPNPEYNPKALPAKRPARPAAQG
jgi:arylsulfatase A-like enzyme